MPTSQLPESSLRDSSAHLEILATQDKPKLSKEQKRFNKLVADIKKARTRIETNKALDHELRTEHHPRVLEAETIALAATKKLILALHYSPFVPKLTPNQKERFDAILLDELGIILGTELHHDDEELKALFASYSPHQQSWNEKGKMGDQFEKTVAAEMLRNLFGIEVSPEDLDDPAAFSARIQDQWQAQAKAAGMHPGEAPEPSPKPTAKKARKLTKAQEAAAAKREAIAAAVKKTTRQIYLDLVKHFHPDREPDEAKRLEKTELMKQITAAYDANDQLKLLELQMTLLSDRGNAYNTFNEAELKFLNQSLSAQLDQLMDESMMAHPDANGNPLADLFDPIASNMRRNVMARLRQLSIATANAKHDLALIETLKGLKTYIKNCQLPPPAYEVSWL